jgi:nucleoside-diphosphate-sugar epimerase
MRRKLIRYDIEGTKNVLKEANIAKIDYFLHTSSTLAYGAHPNNPYSLKESDSLRDNQNFHYSYHKALAEHLIDDFASKYIKDMKNGKIRSSAILSYDIINFVADILRGG